MLVYATRVYTKDLNKQLLIQMVIDWIQENPRNSMDGLYFNNTYPFVYEYNNKKFYINNYEDRNITSIRFLNDNEDIHMQFIVDLIFHDVNKPYLDLHFYKEMDEDSIFISRVSIPKIFRILLKSKYVMKDNEISFYDEPRKMSNHHYKELFTKNYDVPIVIIYGYYPKLEKDLAWNLLGNAHVYYMNGEYKDTIEIIYPKGLHSFYSIDDSKKVSYILREYNITHFYNAFMTFNGLIQECKKRENNINKKETNQIQYTFNQEIEEQLKKLNDLKLEYSNLLKENKQLEYQNAILENEVMKKDQMILNVDSLHKKEVYHSFMIQLLKRNPCLNNTKERYRKADIIASILEEEEQ